MFRCDPRFPPSLGFGFSDPSLGFGRGSFGGFGLLSGLGFGSGWGGFPLLHPEDDQVGMEHPSLSSVPSQNPGQLSGMVIQELYPNGSTSIPITTVKDVMSATTGAPLGMATPLFYPPDKPGPQELVDQQTKATVMDPFFAGGFIAGTWYPGGPNDWKNEKPRGLYDAAANYMPGASSATYGLPFSAVTFVGDADHWGANSAVNNAALWSGYSAVSNGATLQLVPYTLTW